MSEQVTRNKKQRGESMPTLIGRLESGQELLRQLISKHHHELAGCRILLLMTNKEIKSGGVQLPGKVQKATPLLKYLTRNEFILEEGDDGDGDGADVIITVAQEPWNTASERKRAAMLDHLLSRVAADEDETTGKTKLSIVAPPVQEFAEVAERYGAWHDDLVEMKHVLENT